MKYNPSGRHIWITGASSGIGMALARVIAARKPATLIISARSDLSLLAAECLKLGAVAVYSLPFDLSSMDETEGVIKKFHALKLPLDTLINNAGLSQRALARETSSATTERIMRVNCTGTIALTKALLPHLAQQPKPCLVALSSIAYIGVKYRSSYAAAKAGLEAYVKSVALEEEGLSVSIVRPGFVNTSISRNALLGDCKVYATDDVSITKGDDPMRVAERILKNIGKPVFWVATPVRVHFLRFIQLLFPSLAKAILKSLKS